MERSRGARISAIRRSSAALVRKERVLRRGYSARFHERRSRLAVHTRNHIQLYRVIGSDESSPRRRIVSRDSRELWNAIESSRIAVRLSDQLLLYAAGPLR